ncbi:MAG: NAD(P)/FAD-dependent oxidoreductase [Balneolaceae bacterium]|nr:MAG: NAD(P)/FAD-dependent oxidoreductase [Balneolaceae bacterium]
MPDSGRYFDAVVVGSGPNGLAAAIRLALEDLSVLVVEAEETIGGGTRTKELISPGYYHDVCSAIHPMAISSPFLRKLPLSEFGLKWIQPQYPLAHPLDNGRAVIMHRSLDDTAASLGPDGKVYRRLIQPLSDNWETLTKDLLAPLQIPGNPFKMARFGLKALQPAERLTRQFSTEDAKALFGGIAAHSIMALDKPVTSAIGLVLGAAGHAAGWPLPEGGSQMITRSMALYFESLGGVIETGFRVETLDQLPSSKAVLFDLTPRQVLAIAGDRFTPRYRQLLEKFRYGAGVFKIDYILKGPVPWADPRCGQAGTIHLGGTFGEIAAAEKEMSRGIHSARPYVLVAQQSMFDPTRTPDLKHTLWAYCHVPNGSARDMTMAIENQIERFAPGFRDVVEARATMNAPQFEEYNANYIGGDINGGVQDIWQLFSRPVSIRSSPFRLKSLFSPYSTPAAGIYFCSSSAPPGGGVHGMCGYHAAEAALSREFGRPGKERRFKM